MKKLLSDKRTLIAICVAIVVVLVIVIALCLTQCSSNSQSQNAPTQTTTTTTQTNKPTKKADTTSKTEDSSTDEEETSTSSEDISSTGGESTSSSTQSSSSTGGNSYSNSGSSSSQTSSSEQSHEHTWVWVSNVVTITDQEAYDEPVYRWARWCNKCNCEVPNSHNEEMLLAGKTGHSLGDLQVLDHYEHHDAVTHTEDQGYYQCSSCGAIQ